MGVCLAYATCVDFQLHLDQISFVGKKKVLLVLPLTTPSQLRTFPGPNGWRARMCTPLAQLNSLGIYSCFIGIVSIASAEGGAGGTGRSPRANIVYFD